jgi:phospholipase C
MSPLTRRQFLAGSAATAAGAAATRAAATTRRSSGLPAPSSSGLDHIVLVVMENRSFDHYLGWLPGADGRQAGLSYADDHGVRHHTHRLSERQGCSYVNPSHGWTGGRIQLNHGKMDGFRRGGNDDYALGYYTAADLPFYSKLVNEATVFDRWFCSILAATTPNRFYTHAGRTDRITNSTEQTSLPTIWDRLADAGVPASYYFSDSPFLANWGAKYARISKPVEAFFAEAAAGALPRFSYVDPYFIGNRQGGSNDDHPHADIHRGQSFLSRVAHALTTSPQWSRTALVITYDEWGGFFDHVQPPILRDEPARPFNHAQAGFRVPSFLLTPWGRRAAVDHNVYDHTSVLKMIEWRYGLKPLAPRDAAARNLAEAIDFSRRRKKPPALPVVKDPGTHVCLAPDSGLALQTHTFWHELEDRARRDPAWRHVL